MNDALVTSLRYLFPVLVVHSARDAQTRCLGYIVCDKWLQNSIINDIVCVTRTADSYTLKWITPWVHCMWLVVAITIPANSCALARLIHASSKINTFYGFTLRLLVQSSSKTRCHN